MKSPSHSDPVHDGELEAMFCDYLELLLAVLPAPQADIVRAVDLEGRTPEAVAKARGCDLDEVLSGLLLGRQGLKNMFGKMYMICPEHGLAACDCHSKGGSKN